MFTISSVISLSYHLYCTLFVYTILFICGDVEPNPGLFWYAIHKCKLIIQRLSGIKLAAIQATMAGANDTTAISETFLCKDSKQDLNLDGYQPNREKIDLIN